MEVNRDVQIELIIWDVNVRFLTDFQNSDYIQIIYCMKYIYMKCNILYRSGLQFRHFHNYKISIKILLLWSRMERDFGSLVSSRDRDFCKSISRALEIQTSSGSGRSIKRFWHWSGYIKIIKDTNQQSIEIKIVETFLCFYELSDQTVFFS